MKGIDVVISALLVAALLVFVATMSAVYGLGYERAVADAQAPENRIRVDVGSAIYDCARREAASDD